MSQLTAALEQIQADLEMGLSLIKPVRVYCKDSDDIIKKMDGKWIGLRLITSQQDVEYPVMFVSESGAVAYLEGVVFSKRKLRRKLLVKPIENFDEELLAKGLEALHSVLHLTPHSEYPVVRV